MIALQAMKVAFAVLMLALAVVQASRDPALHESSLRRKLEEQRLAPCAQTGGLMWFGRGGGCYLFKKAAESIDNLCADSTVACPVTVTSFISKCTRRLDQCIQLLHALHCRCCKCNRQRIEVAR